MFLISRVFCVVFFMNVWVVTADPCMDLLFGYLEKMAQMSIPKGGKKYHLKMSVSTYAQSGQKDNSEGTANIDIYMSKSFYQYSTDNFSIYSDSKDMLTVIDQTREVIWENGRVDERYMKDNENSIVKLQRNMLKSAKLKTCENITDHGQSFKKIELSIPPVNGKKSFIEKMTYIIDPKLDILAKTDIYYSKDYKIARQTVVYYAIEFNEKKWKSPGSAKELFLNANGKLNKKYKGYKLIVNKK